MSNSNPSLHTHVSVSRPHPASFFMLIALALALIVFALYKGQAPMRTPFPEDWIIWARGTATWAGTLAIGAVVLLIGVIGLSLNLLGSVRPAKTIPTSPTAEIGENSVSSVDLQTATRAHERRGSLSFDARNIATMGFSSAPLQTAAEPPAPALTAHDIQSLEPAIFTDHAVFSDNASDSFMTRLSEPPIETGHEMPVFDANAALLETHGLHINASTADIVPIRPDVALPSEAEHDPLAAALLAETPEVITHAPQGDINAVINSAMRFAPQSDPVQEAAAAPIEPPVQVLAESMAEPVAEGTPDIDATAPVDADNEIRQATRTALSVWPDSTRAIAADELSARVAHLYYDPSPASQKAFQLIASGDLTAAATALAAQAETLAEAGNDDDAAAELWRVSGALHMGRDDARAMAAYEHVSELDPTDANIHLYLARRYHMAGDTARQPAVIARALDVISDPMIRAELLAPYADLKLKAGDVKAAGDAFAELCHLHESDAHLRPDDVGVQSTLAITVARLAQVREMQGEFDEAGPLYHKAYKAFADLSLLKPEHSGLRTLADNALRDARRFNIA